MPNSTHSNPGFIVQRQLDAYNAKDLEALLLIYADDAMQFEFPDRLLAQGTAQLRERFALRFREPNLQAQLVGRLVQGSTVIDQEIVTRTFPEGPGQLGLIMIYEVAGGRIAKAWMIPGERTLQR